MGETNTCPNLNPSIQNNPATHRLYPSTHPLARQRHRTPVPRPLAHPTPFCTVLGVAAGLCAISLPETADRPETTNRPEIEPRETQSDGTEPVEAADMQEVEL